MTVAHCFSKALQIAQHNRRDWPLMVEKLPTECNNADCTTKNCREVCKTWLRMQWRIKVSKETKR